MSREMMNYLCDNLSETPKLYLEKMVEMLLEKFKSFQLAYGDESNHEQRR